MDCSTSRLILARKRRGLNKARLAELADVSVRSLTSYETGKEYPSAPTLAKLARALAFPLEFFTGAPIDELGEESASFRALRRMSARQRDMVQAAGAIAIELLNPWIEERFNLPTPDIPDLREFDPEAAALHLRTRWGLGEQSISNMIHLLESKGVRVFSLAEEYSEVDAFATWRYGKPFVFLNTFKSPEHSRFDAAHELGHLVLHRHGPATGHAIEVQANAFAGAFLMPRARLSALAPRYLSPRHISVEALIKLKRVWGVSVAALAYRLREVGLLSDWNYRGVAIELSQRGFRRQEPESVERETSLVLGKVFQALARQGVKKTDVARELGIPLTELESLVFGLIIASSAGSRHYPVVPGVASPPTLRLIDGVSTPSSDKEPTD